jgi:hypothetical protein
MQTIDQPLRAVIQEKLRHYRPPVPDPAAVQAAKGLLSACEISLTEVALEAGFSDQAAFNRTFKAVSGMTPGQWRRDSHQHIVSAIEKRELAA